MPQEKAMVYCILYTLFCFPVVHAAINVKIFMSRKYGRNKAMNL